MGSFEAWSGPGSGTLLEAGDPGSATSGPQPRDGGTIPAMSVFSVALNTADLTSHPCNIKW